MTSNQAGQGIAPAFQAIIPGVSQVVEVGNESAQSDAFATTTTIVRLYSDEDAYIAFGADPEADESSMVLPGGIVEYFGVVPGTKIAALMVTTGGNLNIVEGL